MGSWRGLRNVCGQKIEVADSSGQTFLKGVGHFKPIGYYFDFYDPVPASPCLCVEDVASFPPKDGFFRFVSIRAKEPKSSAMAWQNRALRSTACDDGQR